jgi:hypothetical protein
VSVRPCEGSDFVKELARVFRCEKRIKQLVTIR